jgi:phage terminase small subunit
MPKQSGKNPALSAKHARFVSEYLIDLNATAAYRRAGFAPKDADVSGHKLLARPEVQVAIAVGKARQMASADLSAARVLEELRRLAFSNVRDYFDPTSGDAKHPHELTAEEGSALAGWEVLIKNAKAGDGVTDTIHKFKLWDKVHSLEILAKHFALLVEKIELKTVTADARVARLVAARKRMEKKK